MEPVQRGARESDGVAASPRAALLAELAERVDGVHLAHPVRVAVDGITASGKSTLARELSAALVSRGRVVRHLTMDGFHNPREVRYRQGRESPDGYYEDAYDFGALVDEVLAPLGPRGDRRYLDRVLDLDSDTPVRGERHELPADAVLVVDGSFLQRPATAGHWDVVVFVNAPLDVARARGIERDAESLGGVQRAGEMYDRRYHAAARRYLAEVAPDRRAHVLVDNADPARPSLTLQHALPREP